MDYNKEPMGYTFAPFRMRQLNDGENVIDPKLVEHHRKRIERRKQMNKQDFINKGWGIGTKLEVYFWPDNSYVSIIYLGNQRFFIVDENGDEGSNPSLSDGWVAESGLMQLS